MFNLHNCCAGQHSKAGPAHAPPAKRSKVATQDYPNLYSIPLEDKLNTLRTMDRTQWNDQVAKSMDDNDATDTCVFKPAGILQSFCRLGPFTPFKL